MAIPPIFSLRISRLLALIWLTALISYDSALSQPSGWSKFNQANSKIKAAELIDLAEQIGREDPYKAISTIKQAIQIGKSLNDSRIIAEAKIVYSGLAYAVLDLNTSSKLFREAFSAAEMTNDSLLMFDAARRSLTSIQSGVNQDQAKQINILEYYVTGGRTDSIRAWARYTVGLLKNDDLSTKADAANFFSSSLKLATRSTDEKLQALSRLALFSNSIGLARADKTDKMLFQAMEFFSRNKLIKELALAENYLADQYRFNGQFAKSIEHYLVAQKYALRLKDQMLSGTISLGLLQTYLASSKYPQMLWYIEQTESIYKKIGYDYGLAIMQNFRGQYFSATGNSTLASIYYDKVDSLNKSIQSVLLGQVNAAYRSINNYKLGRKKKADSLLVTTLNSINSQIPEELQKQSVKKTDQLLESADVSGEMRQVASRFFLDSSFRTRLKEKMAVTNMEAVRFAIDSLNTSTGVPKSLDSVISILNAQKLADLETKYSVKQKTDSLKIQRQQSELIESELERKVLITNLSLAFSAAILFFLYLLHRNYKRIKADKIKILLLQEEIHHRVKNNFAIVSRLVDKAAEKLGGEGLWSLKNRISTFKQLHDHLYDSTKIGKVDMQSYLSEICLLVQQSYQFDRLITILIVSPVELYIGNAQKVGLIVNELVTNSFKYAFENVIINNPEININLSELEKSRFILSVRDNGIGFDTSIRRRSYGVRLIKGLAAQINAEYEFNGGKGTTFKMSFDDTPDKITDS